MRMGISSPNFLNCLDVKWWPLAHANEQGCYLVGIDIVVSLAMAECKHFFILMGGVFTMLFV